MLTQYIVLPEGLSFSKSFSLAPVPITALWYFLHTIPDPRRAQGRRHPLPVVLMLAILAICCGSTSYEAMEEWAKNYQKELQTQVPFLAKHTPDAATFHRVFARLDVIAFEEAVACFVKEHVPLFAGEGIAVDGKAVGKTGVQLVSAFTHIMKAVLFQKGTDTKGKELVVGPQVIKQIVVKDRIVTADALYAQKSFCELIVTNGGGYVFTVKENQPSLLADIRLFFKEPPFGNTTAAHTAVTRWKGRTEKRIVRMSDGLTSYLLPNWPGLTHVWECTREITRNGKTTTEVAVGISSLPTHYATAQRLNEYIRGHWQIENRLHRQRDTVFAEDKTTIRKRNAPEVMAALKNLVLTFFHRSSVRSFPTAFRRFAAEPVELFDFFGLREVAKTYQYA